MRDRWSWGRWLVAVGLPVACALPLAGAADASSCKAMAVDYAVASGNVIALQPNHVDIAYGGCVQFSNNVDLDVTITVAGGYSVTLGPKESTPPKDAYVGRAAGQHTVTARTGPSSATGSITVGAAPSQSPSASRPASPRHTSPPPSSPASRPSSSSSTSAGPRVAPSPPVGVVAPRSHVPSPPGSVPSVAPTAAPLTATPRPSPSPTAPAVVAFPVEPPSGRGTGLPAAVAALAVVGTAAGLVRVLLAEPLGPVDDAAHAVGGRS